MGVSTKAVYFYSEHCIEITNIIAMSDLGGFHATANFTTLKAVALFHLKVRLVVEVNVKSVVLTKWIRRFSDTEGKKGDSVMLT